MARKTQICNQARLPFTCLEYPRGIANGSPWVRQPIGNRGANSPPPFGIPYGKVFNTSPNLPISSSICALEIIKGGLMAMMSPVVRIKIPAS